MSVTNVTLALALSVASCRASDAPAISSSTQTKDAAVERDFSYAELHSELGDAPSRYSAALPTHIQAAAGYWSAAPPPALVASRLCWGDVSMQAKAMAAVRLAVDSGAGPTDLRDAYEASFFGYCGSHELCTWLVSVVRSDEPDDVKWLFWHGMRPCDPALVADTFARADVPAAALLSWFGTRQPAPAYDPRVESLLREQLQQDSAEPHMRALIVDALATLAQIDDPRAIEFVQEVYRSSTERELRRRILFAMQVHPASTAQEFLRQHCSDIDVSMCERARDSALREPSDAVAKVLDAWEPLAAVLEQHPDQQGRLFAALDTCAREQEGWKASHCLASLASQDRARAVALARTGLVREHPPMTLSDILVRFPEPGSLEARLDAIGFLARERGPIEPYNDMSPAMTATEILIERGYVHWFDAETDRFPNQHEILMDELSQLVSPDLDGVTFEEIPPEREREGYTLIAYMDGKRHSVATQALGDWYDLSAVVGMLNSLARIRGVEARFVTLPTTDQTAYVLGASKSAILMAIGENLIHRGEASTAMQLGTEVEAQLLQELVGGQ